MISLLEVIRRSTGYLEKAGLGTPRLDAEWLIAHALGLRRMQLYLQFERPLTEKELEGIRPFIRRRAKREPLQYILGEVDFLGLSLKVDSRALIPRPETEELADWLSRIHPGPDRLLDLGTGSGALALALARKFPQALVTAVDRSAGALALARENALKNGLEKQIRFLESDWFSALERDGIFDWIVSNPPYLSEEEWDDSPPEIKMAEPKNALVAAQGGKADLERILGEALPHLRPGGLLALETGPEHHESLRASAARAGLHDCLSLRDMSGRNRFFVARIPTERG